MEQSHKKLSTVLTVGLWAVLAGYAFVLVKIILLKYGLGAGLRGLNLIPFRFVGDLVHPTTSLGVGLKNVLGNFAIFMPLGVLLPALWRRIDTFWKAAAAGLMVSAAFELLQAVFGLGATDVDDLLLNTLGTAAGAALYFFVFRRFGAWWKTAAASLAFLCVFGLAGVLSLWLFAPGELPRVIEHENVEALNGLDRASYSTSRVLTGLHDGRAVCLPADRGEKDGQPVTAVDAFPMAEDAGYYLETLSYQYSPNGNIQKTFCAYAALDAAAAEALVKTRGTAFADLWLDASGVCTTLLLTVYEA